MVCRCIPRGFAVPLSGMARVKMYRWGNYGNRRPDKKTVFTVFTAFLVFIASAARLTLQTATAIQKLSAKIYRRGMPGFFDGGGGVRGAWARRWHETYKTYKTYKMMMGASCDTPWVCSAAVWLGSGDELPLG